MCCLSAMWGRPDLFPDKAIELAGRLYDSLHEKVLKLPTTARSIPPTVQGHSVDVRWVPSAKRRSGMNGLYNAALQIRDKAVFIQSLTPDMPPAPDHFVRCSDITARPTLISICRSLRNCRRWRSRQRLANPDVIAVDVRSYAAFCWPPRTSVVAFRDLGGNSPRPLLGGSCRRQGHSVGG